MPSQTNILVASLEIEEGNDDSQAEGLGSKYLSVRLSVSNAAKFLLSSSSVLKSLFFSSKEGNLVSNCSLHDRRS